MGSWSRANRTAELYSNCIVWKRSYGGIVAKEVPTQLTCPEYAIVHPETGYENGDDNCGVFELGPVHAERDHDEYEHCNMDDIENCLDQ